ncbi:permease [Nocardioides sp. zg-1228]|uniref:permease n=1 Tax=Nocardioides sp. zg-1228 TaxID=2763008 RepID=UPI0016433736|nr:permease [Nocardioides sp. zg-1228]MBC2932251.1 permease [Nocardioides sp. zg-1228]QSF57777.1 permease [Nocardioides sp. zg-1228]
MASGISVERRPLRVGVAGLVVLVLVATIGFAWSKWLPYWDRALALEAAPTWPSGPIFESAGGDGPSLSGAWDFTVAYLDAVWRAVVVGLLVAAAVDALVPRGWVTRLLNRRSPTGQAVAGGAASLPSMMCSCCTAPVAVGLRRSGVSTSAALAYWVGNPLLNPAVLVFLAFVLPAEYAVTRVVVGLAVVVGASALIGRLLDARGAGAPAVAAPPVDEPVRLGDLPGGYLRSLGRFVLVLVPEYVALVFVMGLLSPWLSDFAGVEASLGVAAVLVVAVLGALLVIPTGGEIPVVAALLALGAGAGTTGALLITLPALSVPSVVMVGRAMGWRATWAMAAAVVLGGVAAGMLLAVAS